MTKKIMELSIAIFFLSISICIVAFIFYGKAAVENYSAVVERQIQQQEELIASANQTKDLVLDVGYGFLARVFEQERLLSPTEANKIVIESLEKITARSEKLGVFATSLNDAYLKGQIH